MLIQALDSYATTYLQDQLADLAFEAKPVRYFLEIDEVGTFRRIVDRLDKAAKSKRAPEMKVPKSPVSRTSRVHPLLLVDALQYVVGPGLGGWTKKDQIGNHQARFEAFQETINSAQQTLSLPELAACIRFFEQEDQVESARAAFMKRKAKTADLVALSITSEAEEIREGPVIGLDEVRRYWTAHFERAQAAKVEKGSPQKMCLIRQTSGPIAQTHEKIKGTSKLGGKSAGVSLMSFDKPAFRSYGWEQNANSPVSVTAAAAYVLALNDLLKPGLHRRGASSDRLVPTRYDLGGAAFLYWTREADDGDIFNYLHAAESNQIKALLEAPETGQDPETISSNDFYLLGVTANRGRLSICDWFTASVDTVLLTIRNWFAGLAIHDPMNKGALAPPPRLSQLLWAISPPQLAKRPQDKGNRSRSQALLRRAIQGQPLPVEILAAGLNRLHVAQGSERLYCPRIGLVRLCVNDQLALKGDPPMSTSIDENNKHPAYLCGRLLALYESQQRTAHDYKINVTLADRYYGLASTYPQLAFPKIEQLARAHQQKLRRGEQRKRAAAMAIERTIGSLMEHLPGRFPAQLSLEDQGRFVVGFHHQKAEDARRVEAAKAKKSNHSEAETSKTDQ